MLPDSGTTILHGIAPLPYTGKTRSLQTYRIHPATLSPILFLFPIMMYMWLALPITLPIHYIYPILPRQRNTQNLEIWQPSGKTELLPSCLDITLLGCQVAASMLLGRMQIM